MEKAFRISGDVPDVTFGRLHHALESLGWDVLVHDDVRLRVNTKGVELEVEVASRDVNGFDYLIMGNVVGARETGIECLQAIARVLDDAGIAYQLELSLDEEDDADEPKVVLRHPGFPKGRFVGE